MPFWTGIAGKARRIIAPFIGVGGKARRVMKGYIGVGGKARIFYDYLDDIDHVEIDFTSIAGWTNISSQGGTQVWSGASHMAGNATLGISGTTFSGENLSGSSALVVYIYFNLYAVLKDGYKLRMNYPYTNDSKGTSVTITQTSNNSPYGGEYYTWLYMSFDGNNDGFYKREQTNTSIVFNWANSSSSFSGMFRLYRGYKAGYRVDKATINGVDYSVTVVNNLSA